MEKYASKHVLKFEKLKYAVVCCSHPQTFYFYWIVIIFQCDRVVSGLGVRLGKFSMKLLTLWFIFSGVAIHLKECHRVLSGLDVRLGKFSMNLLTLQFGFFWRSYSLNIAYKIVWRNWIISSFCFDYLSDPQVEANNSKVLVFLKTYNLKLSPFVKIFY